jgi:hypothetical protein
MDSRRNGRDWPDVVGRDNVGVVASALVVVFGAKFFRDKLHDRQMHPGGIGGFQGGDR